MYGTAIGSHASESAKPSKTRFVTTAGTPGAFGRTQLPVRCASSSETAS